MVLGMKHKTAMVGKGLIAFASLLHPLPPLSVQILPGASPQALPIEQTVAQLQSMGFDDEGGWLTELVKAKGGEIGKVLDALHPSQSS